MLPNYNIDSQTIDILWQTFNTVLHNLHLLGNKLICTMQCISYSTLDPSLSFCWVTTRIFYECNFFTCQTSDQIKSLINDLCGDEWLVNSLFTRLQAFIQIYIAAYEYNVSFAPLTLNYDK